MRILFTGASSFTGSWFVEDLARAGHEVVATFRSDANSYEGVRKARIERLSGLVEAVWGVEFGDLAFHDAVAHRAFDLVCHHGAEMKDYRSWDFDPIEASRKNTLNARASFKALAEAGCGKLIVTGSVFEPFEGAGDPQQRAFSPYGLSKHLSYELLRLEAERLGWSLGKFVIPNPFGPREEMRFTSYLFSEWAAGRTPSIATPVYVRDNIHVSLLTMAYRRLCETMPGDAAEIRAKPSGYIESQGAFARRFAREISARTGIDCALEEKKQTAFAEPLIRFNLEPSAPAFPDWSEAQAWDELAAYYQGR